MLKGLKDHKFLAYTYFQNSNKNDPLILNNKYLKFYGFHEAQL